MRWWLAALLAVATPVAAAAQAVTWTIDPGHSTAEFTVRHMLIANVKGEFDGPTGTVAFDPKDIVGTLRVDATIDARTISTRNSQRDRDLKSANFFDVAKYPSITFKSRRAEAAGAGKFRLIGALTIHGVTKDVTLDVEGPSAQIKDLDGHARIAASATTVVNRRDFGLLYNELLETGGAVVSDEVRIAIELEVTHK